MASPEPATPTDYPEAIAQRIAEVARLALDDEGVERLAHLLLAPKPED